MACLLITGCSDSDADANGDGKITKDELANELQEGGDLNLTPGQWEVTTSFSEFNAPDLDPNTLSIVTKNLGKGTTIKTCLTETDVKEPGANFFGNGEADECEFSEFNRAGDSMVVAMSCKLPGGINIKSKMDGVYAAKSYELKLDSEMSGGPFGEFGMVGTVTGQHIGDCPG